MDGNGGGDDGGGGYSSTSEASESRPSYTYDGGDDGGDGYSETSEATTADTTDASQYAAYGEGRKIAEVMAGYGYGATPKSEWQTFVENSPSPMQSAKMAFNLFTSPISGIYNAVKYNAARLDGMSEAERNNEANIRAEIAALQGQRTGGDGQRAFEATQLANANRYSLRVPGGVSGGVSGNTGGGYSAALDGPQTGAAGSDSAGSSGGSLVVTQGGDSWAKWAAFATVAGVLYEIYKG